MSDIVTPALGAMHESKTNQLFIRVTDGVDLYHWVISYAEAMNGTLAIQADYYEPLDVLLKYGDSYRFKDTKQDLWNFVENHFTKKGYSVTLTSDEDERKMWVAHKRKEDLPPPQR